jgi:hypothetical protein
MLKDGEVLINWVVLGADADVLEDLHDAFVDLFVEEFNAACSFGEGGGGDVKGGGLTGAVGTE